MKFTVAYATQEVFECVCSDENLDVFKFSSILGNRNLLDYCWLEDCETKVWIRIPRIEILRALLWGFQQNGSFSLRICFRNSDDSPNLSPPFIPSKQEKVCEGLEVKEGSDPLHPLLPELSDVSPNDAQIDGMVVIRESTHINAPRLCVPAGNLLQVIKGEAERGISPFDVAFKANELEEVKLTKDVWINCLLRRNPKADLFLEYVVDGFRNLFILGEKLKELRSNKDLWLRLKCFHHDLMHFDKSQGRLQDFGGEFYMSHRYFSSEELRYLLDFPTASGASARQCLQLFFQSKSGFAVCTSHDLAPIVEKVYGIRKGYEEEKAFQTYFKKFTSMKGTFK
eukprot:gene29172-35205_t